MPLTSDLINSTLETLYMAGTASLVSGLIGLPLGVILFASSQPHFTAYKKTSLVLTFLVNALRSVPFIILMIAIIPLTRLIVGTSIGTTAAIVPLTCAAIPFFARICDNALKNLDSELIETGFAIGATPRDILLHILIPECAPDLIRGFTLTLITLIGYSAMAGAIGGGGLGDYAIRYGYQRFQTNVMLETVIILIALVQLCQWLGDTLAKKLQK